MKDFRKDWLGRAGGMVVALRSINSSDVLSSPAGWVIVRLVAQDQRRGQ